MLTCQSPRKVMRAAYHLGRQSLPAHSSKFSRKDYTLPQLFACLVLKEHQRKSYRGVEALLIDSEQWLKDIGLHQAPDHNTLCRAAKLLLGLGRANTLLDTAVRWAAQARMLALSTRPLAIDSSMYESHHVSRHYERRRKQTARQERRKRGRGGRWGPAANAGRRRTVQRLPKLAVAVASGCHLVLAFWSGTGMGADHGHFEPLLLDAWRRVPHRSFTCVQDAGYDSEDQHVLARQEMGLKSITPPEIGRPRSDGAPPSTRWRRHMHRLLATPEGRRRCGYTQRWQSETVNSMMKRNLGSALRATSAWSRKRDMALKVLTHNLMIL